ncbi:MAG: zinc-finger domain-containing protein [Chromatiaceae bacterium]
MAETAERTGHTERVIKVSRKELPLSCPRPQDELWNMHPRVYLPIDETGEEVCPYCGARYVLND